MTTQGAINNRQVFFKFEEKLHELEEKILHGLRHNDGNGNYNIQLREGELHFIVSILKNHHGNMNMMIGFLNQYVEK